MYALVCGRLPWSGKTQHEKMKQIVVADLTPLDPFVSVGKDGRSVLVLGCAECTSLIYNMMKVDVKERMTLYFWDALHPLRDAGKRSGETNGSTLALMNYQLVMFPNLLLPSLLWTTKF